MIEEAAMTDRVDGRAMPAERDEPGSDDLLLRGLAALLGRLGRVLAGDTPIAGASLAPGDRASA
jgi:hypothetical protein